MQAWSRACASRSSRAKFAGARGYVDAIVGPDETRDMLAFVLRVVSNYDGPHLGAYVMPEGV